MRIASYTQGGRHSFGVVTEGDAETGRAVDAGAFHPPLTSVLDVLRAGALPRLATWAAGRPADVNLADVELLPPVTGSAKVLCAGVNYAPHQAESKLAPVEHPTIFTRFADTHVAHGQPLVRPRADHHLDFEGELVAVVGRDVYQESPAQVADAVAGWSRYNDGSLRTWQRHSTQWIPGKNFPGTGGFGPWLVTADEVGDVAALELTTRVNDVIMQQAKLADLLFDVPALLSYVSQFTRLTAGDLLITGTPGGVGAFREPPLWLVPGDEVTVDITGIGTLRNGVVAGS